MSRKDNGVQDRKIQNQEQGCWSTNYNDSPTDKEVYLFEKTYELEHHEEKKSWKIQVLTKRKDYHYLKIVQMKKKENLDLNEAKLNQEMDL